MIHARIRHLPTDSALGTILHPDERWRLEHILLAHIWQATARSKSPHPMLADAIRKARGAMRHAIDPMRRKKLAAARRRAHQRRAALERNDDNT